jgi:hypothetical protein
MGIIIKASALKRGYTKNDVEQVLAERTSRFFPIHEDDEGNPQDMVVGYNQSGVLLEIGITYLDNTDSVFHVNKATNIYKALYKD